MSDLISRKAAIEAMEQRYCDIERVKKRPVTKGEQTIFLDMRGVVRTLPSWRCRMSDLISRQAVKAKAHTFFGHSVIFEGQIDALPSADAAEVVRCKDCKHRYISGNGTTRYYVCDFMDAQYEDNGFCHHGERKGGEE